eukprot:gene2672-540_t
MLFATDKNTYHDGHHAAIGYHGLHAVGHGLEAGANLLGYSRDNLGDTTLKNALKAPPPAPCPFPSAPASGHGAKAVGNLLFEAPLLNTVHNIEYSAHRGQDRRVEEQGGAADSTSAFNYAAGFDTASELALGGHPAGLSAQRTGAADIVDLAVEGDSGWQSALEAAGAGAHAVLGIQDAIGGMNDNDNLTSAVATTVAELPNVLDPWTFRQYENSRAKQAFFPSSGNWK